MIMTHRLSWLLTALCVLATHLAWVNAATQPAEEHLSPLIAKLAADDLAFGVSTYDLSLENARSLARSDLDYVYVDMEHGPMDFVALQTFLLGLTDRAAVAEQGSVAQTVTPLVRLAPYGRESPDWAAKQALDIGVMGLISPRSKPRTRRDARCNRCGTRSAATPGIPSHADYGARDRRRPPGSGACRRSTTSATPTPGRSIQPAIWWLS